MSHSGGNHARVFEGHMDPLDLVDPTSLRILLIHSTSSCQNSVLELLRECSYQVTASKTSKEAMDLLMKTLTEQSEPGFDLILKDHEPTRKINACRLLRKLSRYRQLRQIPVVVMSSQDDRDTVVKCLHLGAADYLVKPLRHNELRNLWTRVWWRRIVNTYRSQDAPFLSQGSLASNPVPELREHGYPSPPPTLSASEETKCDEDEPTSKEGSAPVGEGSGKGTDGEAGSGGDAGSGGSGANVSRVPPYILEDGNGNSGSKNCITGHGSATKNGGSGGNMGSNGNGSNGNGGSNGNRNGASTTHALEGPSSNALRGTAQGGTREFVGRHAAKAATAADDMSPYSGETNIKIGQSSKRSHGGHQLLKESNKKAASAGVDENKPFHAAADEPKTAPPNRKVSGSLERSGRTEARDKVERYSNGGVWQSARAEVKSGTASGGLHIPSRGAETVSEDTQMRVTGTSSGRPGTSPQRASGLGPGSRNSFGKAHASQSGTACGSYPGQVTDSGLELPHLNPQMWPTPYPAAHMQQMPPGMQHPFASWNPSQFDMIHGSGYHPYHALFMRQAQNGSTHPALQEQRQSPGHPAWIPGFDSQGTRGHSAMYGSRGGPRSGYPGGYDQSVGAGFYASHGMVPSTMEYPYTDGGKNQWLYPYYPGVSGRPGQGSNRQEHGDAVHRSRPSNHTEHQIPGAVGKTLSYSKPVGSPSAGGAEDRQDGTGAVHASPQRTQLPYRQEGGDPGTTHTPIVNESGETVDLRTAKERRAAAMWRYKQKRKNFRFTKVIRYASRKQLAEQRPRIKGQFVRSKKQDGENDTASIPDTAPLDEEYMPDHEVEDEHVEDNVDDEDEPMGEDEGIQMNKCNGGSDSGSNSPDDNRHGR